MRHLLLLPLLASVAACSPTTDVTHTSSEVFAGRATYEIVRQETSGRALRVRLKVASMRAARTIAEDVVVQKRAPYGRVDVEVVPDSARPDAPPAAVLHWSETNGFSYSENR
ncbi:MAG: hypothetical protein ACM3NQ_17910 [Bacteroidales bacterium]